jgi:hypothetical protein
MTSNVSGEGRWSRYVIIVGLFLMMTINFMAASVYPWAGGSLARTCPLSPIKLGDLFSAYSWTYTVSLVPIGLRIDR